jgi:DnaJ domain
MPEFLAGAAVLAIVVLALWLFANVNPASLARLIRYGIAALLFGLAALFAFGDRWSFALILGALAVSVITVGRVGPFDLGGSRRKPGSASTVRSAFLDMRLDHDTGTMNGTVTAGRYAGRSLDDLTEPSLRELLEEAAADADSVALLEGYLDRRFPGWREHIEGDEAPRAGRAPDASAMTDQQAYEILGLAAGASEAEIRAAHRRLMKAVHPDQGGSTFLAAKINQAKDWLLGRHGTGRTRD